MNTAESIFSNFVIEYLGQIETEFENTSACLSGAQMGSNHEKNWRSKISWHDPNAFGQLLLEIKDRILKTVDIMHFLGVLKRPKTSYSVTSYYCEYVMTSEIRVFYSRMSNTYVNWSEIRAF